MDERIVAGLGRRGHLGEPGTHLRQVLGETVDPGVRRLAVAQRGKLTGEFVDTWVGERGRGGGQILACSGERPGEIIRRHGLHAEPAVDLVETSRQRLLRLALCRQSPDAVGDLVDPLGRGDRSSERGNLVTHGAEALAELVEPLGGGRILLGREALTDVRERRGEVVDPLLELLEAGVVAVVAPRHLVDSHSELGDRGGKVLVLVRPGLEAGAKGFDLAGVRLGRQPLRELGFDPGEPLVELGIADGPRLQLRHRRAQLAERLRLLIEGRGGSGILGQHGEPLLEGHQRLVQRDDLIRGDDVLDASCESAQPTLQLCRVDDRAIPELRDPSLDRGQ